MFPPESEKIQSKTKREPEVVESLSSSITKRWKSGARFYLFKPVEKQSSKKLNA